MNSHVYRRASVYIRHVHGVSSYNVGTVIQCTMKTEVIVIHFQLLIFRFPLSLRELNFIVNGMNPLPLT